MKLIRLEMSIFEVQMEKNELNSIIKIQRSYSIFICHSIKAYKEYITVIINKAKQSKILKHEGRLM